MFKSLSVLSLILVSLSVFPVNAEESSKPIKQEPIYTSKNPASQDFEVATRKANTTNKHTLLMFGADWCPWCHKLFKTLNSDESIRKTLANNYELVLVNVDDDRNTAFVTQYGNPKKIGIPFLAISNKNKKTLVVQETGSLEKGEIHDADKINAFLDRHKPKQPQAGKVLADVIEKGKKQDKPVFVCFTAPWCVWCHRLTDYLVDGEVAPVLEQAFVLTVIDVERMAGGQEIMTRIRLSSDASLPYFAILDSEGDKIADSVSASGNVGFPAEKHEIAHFLTVIRKCSGKLSEKQLTLLKSKLKKTPETRSKSN